MGDEKVAARVLASGFLEKELVKGVRGENGTPSVHIVWDLNWDGLSST